MKIGFVGFGAQTRENLLPACRSLSGIEVAAVCDRDPKTRREITALHGFDRSRVFETHQEMMECCQLDAVIAACYPSDHYKIACDALDRRLPVFIEKPLAPSLRHVEDLIQRAAMARVVTGVGMNFRFAEIAVRLADLANGKFNMITLRQLANKPAGTLWDYSSPLKSFLHAQTIHGLDLLIHLCGTVRNLEVFDDNLGDRIVFTVLIQFNSGAHGTLITSNTSPHFVFDFDAVCQNTLHIAGRSLWELTVSELGKSYGNGERKRWRDTWAPSPVASGFSRAGYQGELEDFISAIRAGKTECRTHFGTLHETYRCLELIEAACNRRNQLVSEMAS